MNSLEKLRDKAEKYIKFGKHAEIKKCLPDGLSMPIDPQTVALLLDVVGAVDNLDGHEHLCEFWNSPPKSPKCSCGFKELMQKRKALDKHLGGVR